MYEYAEEDLLTLRELKEGERFIAVPTPGNNHDGHGGLKKETFIFVKTRPFQAHGIVAGESVISDENAIRIFDGMPSNMPPDMPVIHVYWPNFIILR